MYTYTSELLKERITATVKAKGYTIKAMLSTLELNENTINQISDKKGLSSFSLAMIADYLDCSVDYLLGRTDKSKPEAEVIKDNHGSAFIGANVTELPVTIVQSDNHQLDEMQKELLHRFGELSFTEKLKIMQELVEKTEGE